MRHYRYQKDEVTMKWFWQHIKDLWDGFLEWINVKP